MTTRGGRILFFTLALATSPAWAGANGSRGGPADGVPLVLLAMTLGYGLLALAQRETGAVERIGRRLAYAILVMGAVALVILGVRWVTSPKRSFPQGSTSPWAPIRTGGVDGHFKTEALRT
jgi:hypothetical protein